MFNRSHGLVYMFSRYRNVTSLHTTSLCTRPTATASILLVVPKQILTTYAGFFASAGVAGTDLLGFRTKSVYVMGSLGLLRWTTKRRR